MSSASSKRSTIVLHALPLDPYCHRIRFVLAEKGVSYDLIHIENNEQKEALLQLNPYQSVPTLEDRDLILYQSGVIMEYLDERFPHPPLMPIYPVARARARLMIYRIERDWYALMHRIEQGNLTEAEKARKKLKDSILSTLSIFQEMPFFMHEELSLLDCCLAPLFWRLESLGISLPAEAQPIKSYMKRIFNREGFQNSLTAEERALGG